MASMYQNLPSNRCSVQNSVLVRTVLGYAYQKHFIFGEHEMKSSPLDDKKPIKFLKDDFDYVTRSEELDFNRIFRIRVSPRLHYLKFILGLQL